MNSNINYAITNVNYTIPKLIEEYPTKQAIRLIKRYNQFAIMALAILFENLCKDPNLRARHIDLTERTFRYLSKKLILGEKFIESFFVNALPLFSQGSILAPQTTIHLIFHRKLYNSNSAAASKLTPFEMRCVEMLDQTHVEKYLKLPLIDEHIELRNLLLGKRLESLFSSDKKQAQSLMLESQDLKDKELKQIISSNLNLEHLELSALSLSLEDWEAIARLKNLKTLKFSDCSGYEEALEKIADSCDELISVSFQQNQSTIPSPSCITARCLFNHVLKEILRNNLPALEILLSHPECSTFIILKRHRLTILHIMATESELSNIMGEQIVQAYCKAGGDINAVDWKGSTALMVAVKNRNSALALALIDNHANPSIFDYAYTTPIRAALQNQDLFLVNLLLSKILFRGDCMEISYVGVILHVELNFQKKYPNLASNTFLEERYQSLNTPEKIFYLEGICKALRYKLRNLLVQDFNKMMPISKETIKKYLENAIVFGDMDFFYFIYDLGKRSINSP